MAKNAAVESLSSDASSQRPPDRAPARRWFSWFQCLAILYALSIAAAAAAFWLAGDRTWWGTLIIFSPRWVFGLPLVVLAPWALVRRPFRRSLAVWIAAAGVLWPIMGLNLPWRKELGHGAATQLARFAVADEAAELGVGPDSSRPSAAAQRTWRLKLLTCNTGNVSPDALSLLELVRDADREVLTFQETTPANVPKLVPADWHCGAEMASRYPLKLKATEIDNGILGYWGGFAEIYELESPIGPVDILVLHLQTPRPGIQAFLEGRSDARDKLNTLLNTRSAISNRARSLLKQAQFPFVVAGDFNMPVESALYQRDWADLRNAFTIAGWGFGNTKFTRLHGARIDHVLVDGHWQVDRCWVGPHVGSDHRPVLADLTLTAVGE